MYLGKLVELAGADALYDCPRHPYTQALLSAIPIPDPVIEAQRRRTILAGDPESAVAAPRLQLPPALSLRDGDLSPEPGTSSARSGG